MVISRSRKRRIELIIAALSDTVDPKLLKGFSGKLIVQKIAYLLQEAFGINLGVKFVWHSYGPYSFEIAKDYKLIYNIYLAKAKEDHLVEQYTDLLSNFKEFLDKVKQRLMSNEEEIGYWLEIIASLYMLSKKIYPPPEDLVDELLERKPYVSRHDVIRALRLLKEEGLL